jgi:hypothetical protein
MPHWIEEAQHARFDALMFKCLAQRSAAQDIANAMQEQSWVSNTRKGDFGRRMALR